jgi:hypothetical protein
MIKIINEIFETLEIESYREMVFQNTIKYVVDIQREIIAIGGDMHADGAALLLDAGSNLTNLWGANFYPFKTGKSRIEYTSFINIRPQQDNYSMEISKPEIRKKVELISEKLILAVDDTLA